MSHPRFRLAGFLGAGLLVLHGGAPHAFGKELFRHSSFDDFRSGTFSNAGQNAYVRSDGTLRLIHRYDFNNDGFADILVLNDHNHFDTPPAVLYRNRGKEGFQSLTPPLWKDMPLYQVLEHYVKARDGQTFLPALGGVAAAVGDLNGDGYADIAISNFVHGWDLETFPMSIYWGGKEGFHAEKRFLLDGYFSEGIASADMDGDGIADLAIACRGPEYEIAANQRLPLAERERKAGGSAKKSVIVYGSREGSGSGRKVEFSTLYAIDVAVEDVNGDARPDLVFLEAGSPGSVRIYLATPGGFAKEPLTVEVGDVLWETIRSRKICVADLNHDNAPDVIVPEKSGLRVLWNDGKGGFAADRRTVLPIEDSYAACVGDFNGDGKPDLAVAVGDATPRNAPSVVLMNQGGPIETWKAVFLPTQVANAVTAADLNGDGYDDLAVANYQNGSEASMDTDSFIYWGSARGISPDSRTDLATFGAVDVKTVPSPTASGLKDLLFVNRQSGRRGVAAPGGGPTDSGGLPTYVYWGNGAACYSPADMTRFPASTTETSAEACDLTGDGNAELVLLTHHGHAAGIYTLKDKQYTLLRKLPLPGLGQVPLVADLDKDGKLDLLVMARETAEAYLYSDVLNGSENPAAIRLPKVGYSAALGDLDGDGNLDVVSAGVGGVFVVYGSKKGLDSTRTLFIPEDKFFAKVALADLDNDGALDVVAFAWNEPSTGKNRTDSVIFWNRAGKIDGKEISPLPTLGGAHQGTIADVNGDGCLDIVSSNYHGGDDRHLDVQVFLGDGRRTYTRERSWTVPGFSSAANQVMDYNRDGFQDLLVFNHSESTEKVEGRLRGGMHSTGAWLYWGDKNGFSTTRRSWIPTYGPHNKLNVDAGDLMRRSPVETFTSAAMELPRGDRTGRFLLTVRATAMAAGSLKASLKVREKHGGPWVVRELPQRSREGDLLTFGPVALAGAEAMEYRLELDSEFLGVAPVVREVRGVLEEEEARGQRLRR